MKAVRYSAEALRDLRRHGNVAGRIRRAIADYAAETGARSNNVTPLVGSSASRLRVGDFRVIFEDGADTIIVTRIGPRGDVYD